MKYTKSKTKQERERERGEGGKTPKKPKNRRKPKDPYKISPQNLETKTSYQRPSCLALARTKTPGIIINCAL